jgi:hypothetical protein
MTRAQSDSRFLLLLGIVTLILFGVFFRYRAADSMLDFQEVYCGARLFVHHQDPYNPSLMSNIYNTEFGESDLIEHHKSMIYSVYFPTAYFVLAPIGKLPWEFASALWNVLTLGSLIVAACLLWREGAQYAPVLSGALAGFAVANGAVVFANGNPAGVVVGLCVIAVWCLTQDRLPWLGILCLVVSFAVKPQDAGLLWLFFLLRPGVFRKRALQTMAITILVGAAAALWTWHIAPHMVPEFRANFAEWSGPGGNSDPGPTGLTSKSGTMEVITGLQAVVSVFRDSPSFYNSFTILFCGSLLIVWAVTTLGSDFSRSRAWTALAALTPLSLIVTYHRAYDARLLLLCIPACAMLWAKRNATAKIALAVTTVAFVFTGEVPLAFLNPLLMRMHVDTGSLLGKFETVLLMRLAVLSLLAMCLFYLWIYLRQRHAAPAIDGRAADDRETARVWH